MNTVGPVDAAVTGSRMRRAIVTLTPAPAIDRTYVVSEFASGAVHRTDRVTESLGGNGINITRALAAHGHDTVAVFPMARAEFDTIGEDDLEQLRPIDHRGRTRVNTVIVTPDGATTNVNEAPASISTDDWTRLGAAALRQAVKVEARWLVVTGCLPGATDGQSAVDLLPLIVAARSLDLSVAVDVPGHQLGAVLTPLAPVDLIKPNRAELAEATGVPVDDIGDTITAARVLLSRGARRALVSLGSDGMVLVDPDQHHFVPAAVVDCVDTTGAGDAALAGYLAADVTGARAQQAARQAIRWGGAAVGRAGARLRPTPLTRADVIGRRPDVRRPTAVDLSDTAWLRTGSLAAIG